ncbi:MAG: hypothetical protein ACI841_001164 [Planctomycetota bacterium]|jgi:uncharacterized protein YceH (UPF0502 family)
MQVELNAHEARVLGVLIEKAMTTPDQFPLTMNATINGCNQKSNRDPVVDFVEAEVHIAYQGLMMKQLVGSSFPAGSRGEKWHHNARASLKLNDVELAIIAELLMRGPQATGVLRTRVTRMARCEDLTALMTNLNALIERGLVKWLPPAPGSRAERYGQMLAPGLHPDGESAPVARPMSYQPQAASLPSAPPPAASGLGLRISKLEEELANLKRQLSSLADQLGADL